MNINKLIFSRVQPQKKIDTINTLSREELFSIEEWTVKRIVKEIGIRIWRSRSKRLRISHERRAGNSWNSSIDQVDLIKGKLYLEVYLQYENTDTTSDVEFEDFFRSETFRGEVRRSDRYGNDRTYYYNYDVTHKARVMRSILLEYIYQKYATKLKEDKV